MSKSYLWSGLIALAIVGWFGSGLIVPAASPDAASEGEKTSEQDKSKPFKVGVKTFTAQQRPAVFPVRGLTEAAREIEVRARTSGIVQNQRFESGDRVKKGELLCELDLAARNAQLARAKAQLASARRTYDASAKLAKRNYTAKTKVAVDKAALELAAAELEQVEMDIAWTKIAAPHDGVLKQDPAQSGAFLQAGALCGTLSVMDPMVVVASVPERLLPNISQGMPASAKLVTGQEVSGKISKIAMSSDTETRTFRVELSVANEKLALREGVTAELFIPLPTANAHKLPSSALTLSDDGSFGVRVVNEKNVVSFVPLKIISQETDGVWASGLPPTATVIVQGQDFVTAGQVVEPVQQSAEAN